MFFKRYSSFNKAKYVFDSYIGIFKDEDLYAVKLELEYSYVYWTKKRTNDEILNTLNKVSE